MGHQPLDTLRREAPNIEIKERVEISDKNIHLTSNCEQSIADKNESTEGTKKVIFSPTLSKSSAEIVKGNAS